MNHRCFPRRFRATADWRETKSAVALNLRGNPAFMVPTHVEILEVSPAHETLPALQNLSDPEISLAKAGADNLNIVLWPPWLGSSVGRAED